MQVHCDEGVAIRIGPRVMRRRPARAWRSVDRGAHRPAIVAKRAGRDEPRKTQSRMPTWCATRKATRTGAPCERLADVMRHACLRHDRGRRTWHVRTLFVSGNREISYSTARAVKSCPPVRIGKASWIGVGIGFRRPRPPNRTGGFPAYGSPVGGFLIGAVSLVARLCSSRTARQPRRRHLASVD